MLKMQSPVVALCVLLAGPLACGEWEQSPCADQVTDGGTGGADGGTGGADAGTGDTDGGTIPPGAKRIFVTYSPYGGNLGGIHGADFKCQIDSNRPTGGSYKALLSDGTTRIACTTADCAVGGKAENIDWVAQPDTLYIRPDGTRIGTTTAAGIFRFPLANSFGNEDGSNPGFEAWMGMNKEWTSSSRHCKGWTNSASYWDPDAAIGDRGIPSMTDRYVLQNTGAYCDILSPLVCVEQ
ncbi:DUF1554 domain-containing protein [Archangium violaceum]|uniref:DUF1554 domain-containing protein n=1 Tax=Archangium violaceum TaxID=83451 RepID=UPI002B2C33B4|nr:DUF1554 domain-containing protein [Archangium gephyra]